MKVFQTNPDGVFLGETVADPDPLQEGNWLIPAGCVTIAPPPIPAAHMAMWDGKGWNILPTPLGEIDPAPTLPPTHEQIRAAAALTKPAFCMALFKAGILTKIDAAEAARGKWPTQFEPALAGMSDEGQLAAMLAWSDAAQINRMAPLFLSLLAFYGKAAGKSAAETEALGDAIFGIEG